VSVLEGILEYFSCCGVFVSSGGGTKEHSRKNSGDNAGFVFIGGGNFDLAESPARVRGRTDL